MNLLFISRRVMIGRVHEEGPNVAAQYLGLQLAGIFDSSQLILL
jgi:hypothetical protein